MQALSMQPVESPLADQSVTVTVSPCHPLLPSFPGLHSWPPRSSPLGDTYPGLSHWAQLASITMVAICSALQGIDSRNDACKRQLRILVHIYEVGLTGGFRARGAHTGSCSSRGLSAKREMDNASHYPACEHAFIVGRSSFRLAVTVHCLWLSQYLLLLPPIPRRCRDCRGIYRGYWPTCKPFLLGSLIGPLFSKDEPASSPNFCCI
ncbi:hypothetical protein GGR56DRAFT_545237 [Xylariaceae sp. FL0804]|nr:hypothetical protein GGR56DRAFT_545237 [Xylariaceae sp. FL0804]